MWEISAAVLVHARHRIRGPSGAVGEEHSHVWRVRAVVQAAQLDATGWVLDFNHLAALLRQNVAPYDRAFLNEIPPFDDVSPTRENVARHLADGLAAAIDDGRARLQRIEIWEGEACCATFVR
jgi:6-pyruvoyltetrahydropterin/6-carboxytetrahydropterin synthase